MTSEKILIVDDTPGNIGLLADALEPRGYEILAASRAQEALKIAAESLPDLILLDVVMPDSDGFAVCRALKKIETTRAIPVLFVTAKDETEYLLRGFRSGAVDYIPKPFRPEEVLVRVETHLKIARLTREISERNRALEAEIARRQEAEEARRAVTERLMTLSEQEMKRWATMLWQMTLLTLAHRSPGATISEATDFSTACMFDISKAAGMPLPATSAMQMPVWRSLNLSTSK